jgi:hypothetical protein
MPRVFLELAIQAIQDHFHDASAEVVFDLDEIWINE